VKPSSRKPSAKTHFVTLSARENRWGENLDPILPAELLKVMRVLKNTGTLPLKIEELRKICEMERALTVFKYQTNAKFKVTLQPKLAPLRASQARGTMPTTIKNRLPY
jgi:hypothetical protein